MGLGQASEAWYFHSPAIPIRILCNEQKCNWPGHPSKMDPSKFIFYFRINCDIDLIVSGVALMQALNQDPGQQLDSVTIDSMEDFTNTFTHYFTKGMAAERTFTSGELYDKIVTVAETIPGKEVSHRFR